MNIIEFREYHVSHKFPDAVAAGRSPSLADSRVGGAGNNSTKRPARLKPLTRSPEQTVIKP